MGRPAKDELQRVGPRLWARFLQRHFGCTSLRPLNAQLLFPIAPKEVFRFGKCPKPLGEEYVPKVFERAYDLGRTPDGPYTSGIWEGTPKFNLYERVTQRVPESKYWLLKEMDHFLVQGAPSIDASVGVAWDLTETLRVLVLEADAVSAWGQIDDAGAETAEFETLEALCNNAVPEVVSMTLALFHLAVWMDPMLQGCSLANKLSLVCHDVTRAFFTLLTPDFDITCDISDELRDRLKVAIDAIEMRGARSLAQHLFGRPPELAHRLILVPDTSVSRRAVACLLEAQLHGRAREYEHVTKSTPQAVDDIRCERTGGLEPEEAVGILAEAATETPKQLHAYSSRVLGGYQYVHPTPRFATVGGGSMSPDRV